jgi:hypothetical protein
MKTYRFCYFIFCVMITLDTSKLLKASAAAIKTEALPPLSVYESTSIPFWAYKHTNTTSCDRNKVA